MRVRSPLLVAVSWVFLLGTTAASLTLIACGDDDAGTDASADTGRDVTVDVSRDTEDVADAQADVLPDSPDDTAADTNDAGFPEGPFTRVAVGLDWLHWDESAPAPCYLDESVFCGAVTLSGGVAVGDVDGNGFDDVYATRMDAADLLFLNEGGVFREAHLELGLPDDETLSSGAAFGDVDGDGDLDLAVGSVGEREVRLFINEGGRFSEEGALRGAALNDGAQHLMMSLCLGDVSGDGYADLMTTEWRDAHASRTGTHQRLLINRGPAQPGYFDDRTTAAGVEMEDRVRPGVWGFTPEFVDLDRDGSIDIAFASDFGTSALFYSNGDGTFLDGTTSAGVGTAENAMGSTFGDFDGDGDLDWFVTSIFDARCSPAAPCDWGSTGNRLYRNEGGRRFVDVAEEAGVVDSGWGWGTSLFDYDHDGDLDLIATNGVDFIVGPRNFLGEAVRFYENDGGRFTERGEALGIAERKIGRGIVTFDYDRDGDLDVLITNYGDRPSLYRNDSAAGHWLVVSPTGAGVRGARVEVTAGGRTLMRMHGLGCGFLGNHAGHAHFGLADATVIDEVTVTLISGETRVLADVAVDQYLEVAF